MQGIWQLDQQLFWSIHVGQKTAWMDPIMIVVTTTGLGQVQLAALLIFMIRQGTRRYALAALYAGLFTGAVRLLIMKSAGRMRPSNFDFARPMEEVFGRSSFPSGHASTSFAIAFMLFLMLRSSSKWWIGWLMVLWAVAVGFSRIYVGVHFPTDILGGAALGAVCASATYLMMMRRISR